MIFIVIIFITVAIIILGMGIAKASSTITSSPKSSYEKKSINIADHLNPPESQSNVGLYLFIDIETTGLPKNRNASPGELENWPRIVQIAWLLADDQGADINSECFIIKQKKKIPIRTIQIHGITDEIAKNEGRDITEVLELLKSCIKNSKYVIAHNISFDIPIIESEFIRAGHKMQFDGKYPICTMEEGTEFCCIPKSNGNGYKWPKLIELYTELFYPGSIEYNIKGLHNAGTDVLMTRVCFLEMVERGIINL